MGGFHLTAIIHPELARGFTRIATGMLKGVGKAMGASLMGFIGIGLASGIGQVTSAFAAMAVQATGALGVIPAAAGAAALAIGTLKLATMGLGDSIKAILANDMKKFDKSLENMPPALQKFARAIRDGVLPALNKLKADLSASMFKGLAEQIKPLVNLYMPALHEQMHGVAHAFNDAFKQVTAYLKTEEGVASYKKTLANLGTVSKNAIGILPGIFKGLTILMETSSEVLAELSGGFIGMGDRFAEWMKELRDSGRLKEFIQGGVDALKELGRFLGAVGSILKSVFVDAAAGGETFFGVMTDLLEQTAKFLNSAEGMDMLRGIFGEIGAVGKELGRALGVILPELGRALKEALPGLRPLAKGIADALIAAAPLLPILGEIAGGAGKALGWIFEQIGKLSPGQLAGIAAGIGAISLALAFLVGGPFAAVGAIAASIIAIGTAVVYAYKKFEGFRKVVDAALGGIKEAWQTFIEAFKKNGDEAQKSGFFRYIQSVAHIARGVFDYLKDGWTTFISAFKQGGTDAEKSGFAGWMQRLGMTLRALFDWIKNTAFPALRDFYGWLGPKLEATWNGFIKPTLEKFFNILNFVWDLIVHKVIPGIAWAWNNVLKPTFETIGTVVSWLWNTIIKPVFGFIRALVTTVFAVIKFAWDNVLKPTFNAIGTVLKFIWEVFLKPIFGMIRIAFGVLVYALKAFWDNVLKPVFNAIATVATWLWKNVLSPAWEGIKTGWRIAFEAMRTVWNNVLKPVFDKVKEVVGTLKGAFDTAVSGIKTAWDKLKEVAAAPVRFMVNTVFNNGIRKAWNWIADKTGQKGIDPIVLPFAKGGIVPGSGNKDTQPAMLTPGEGILTKDEMKSIGGAAGFNRMREEIASQGQRKNAIGGPIDWFKDKAKGVGDFLGDTWDKVKDAVRGALSGPLQLILNPIKNLINQAPDEGMGKLIKGVPLQGINWLIDWVKGDDKKNAVTGGPLGAGGIDGGYRRMFAMLKSAFPGATLTSGFRPGSRTLSGNQSYHALGRAIDVPPVLAYAQWIRSNFGSKTKELISPWNDLNLWNGRPHRYTGAVWNQHNFAGGNAHVHWAMDQGGMIQPGWNPPIWNGTGKPEPVFTNKQFANIDKLAGSARAGKASSKVDETTIARVVAHELHRALERNPLRASVDVDKVSKAQGAKAENRLRSR